MLGADNEKEKEAILVEHRAVHNVYGLFNSMTTHQALSERGTKDQRTFHLSRSFFAGSQKQAATVWTADCRYIMCCFICL